MPTAMLLLTLGADADGSHIHTVSAPVLHSVSTGQRDIGLQSQPLAVVGAGVVK